MHRVQAALAATALLGASLAAAAADPALMAPDRAPAAGTKAFGGVVAPGARLAGLFRAGGTPVRTKGVASIQRIGTGIYCIRPAAGSGIDVATIVPVVSAEYFYSQLNEVMVQWAAAQTGCGLERIGVYTLADAEGDGTFAFSNAVAFTIVVP